MKKRLIQRISVILIASMLILLCACTEPNVKRNLDTETPTYKVAMAIADITPSMDVYLDGYEDHDEWSLAKYPDNFTTDLNARILIIDNGEDRLVFVNLEMVCSGAGYEYSNLSEHTLNAIAEVCQTSSENVLLSNTHNHQANKFLDQAEEAKILQAVRKAYARLAPATIGTTTVNSEFGMSRGGYYTVDKYAPYDSLMNIVRFDNAETGKPIGLVYSVPMHGTMFGSGPNSRVRHNLLNCEFTGYTSRAIEAAMAAENPFFTAIHINGFTGNATPYANGKYYAESLGEMESNGQAFAKEILEGYQTIETKRMTGSIKTDYVLDELTFDINNQELQAYQWKYGNEGVLPLRVKVGAFGEIGFVGVNAEPFSIIGARLKAESPYRILLLASSVDKGIGYIPTKEAVTMYEKGFPQAECMPAKSPFGADGEEAFYAKVLDAVCDLADVKLERVPLKSAGVKDVGVAAYMYTLETPAALDKLVISFGQESRKDCAQNFELKVFDAAGEVVYSQILDGNSVNYLGVFLDGKEVSSAMLLVHSCYGNASNDRRGTMDLQPQLWGIQFEDK